MAVSLYSVFLGAVPKRPKGEVCKTSIRGFKSHPRLQSLGCILFKLTASGFPCTCGVPLVSRRTMGARSQSRNRSPAQTARMRHPNFRFTQSLAHLPNCTRPSLKEAERSCYILVRRTDCCYHSRTVHGPAAGSTMRSGSRNPASTRIKLK